MSLKTCSDMAEAIPLEPSLGLYLKPISRIKINVQLPRLSVPGQSISSWHVMEKLKETVRPDTFLYLKSLKIASNVIKFEGELETKNSCERALARLRAAGSLKVSGFAEKLQIRAAHAPCSGPTRHDWEAFFRDAKGVNEMKPGERPDTIHLEEMPLRWFADSSKSTNPSEKCLQKAFGTFGKIRRLEIQRNEVSSDNTFGKTSSLHSDLMFEAYIQYEEYIEFSIAMDSLRGKKLLYKEPDGKVYSADIKVDFDRTNYLSDKCIKMRESELKKLNSTPTPDKTNISKDISEKNLKMPPSKDIEISSAVAEKAQVEKTSNKTLEKEKGKNMHLEEQNKAQKEAKLLIKELLRRAEKHKKKMDEKLSAECISHESHKVQTEPKNKQIRNQELKRSTKKVEVEQSEMCANQKREERLSFQKEKKEKLSHKCISGDVQELNQSKESQKTIHVKENEECVKKKSNKDKAIVLSNFHKPTKKQNFSQEFPKDPKRKTQSFYEVKKRKPSSKEDTEVLKKRIKSESALTDKRSKEEDAFMHHPETNRNVELLKRGNKSKELESTVHCKTTEKHFNSGSDEKKDKERMSKLLNEERKNREKLIQQERILKEKLLKNMKAREEEKLRNREKLRRKLAGRKILKSVLIDKHNSPLYKKS